MKKITSLLLAAVLSIGVLAGMPFSALAETPIYFPDANFEAAVRENIDKPIGDIYPSDVASLTRLDLYSYPKDIQDLTGIEYFTYLTYLDVSNNNLTSINVSNNEYLLELYCDNNNLTSLDVSQNFNLRCLYCADNNISTLDLSNNPDLYLLICSNNELTTLDLSSNLSLQELYCAGNNLTSLDVSQYQSLWRLDCSDNNLTTLYLPQKEEFYDLWCSNNKLTSLDLSNIPDLSELDCSNNNLTALDVSQNEMLNWLYCSMNYFESTDDIIGFERIYYFDFYPQKDNGDNDDDSNFTPEEWAEITASAIPIALDTASTAFVENEEEPIWFSFIPAETAPYNFYTNAPNADTDRYSSYAYGGIYIDVNLYDSNGKWLEFDNVSLIYLLEKGKTYYYEVVNYEENQLWACIRQPKEIKSMAVVANSKPVFVENVDGIWSRWYYNISMYGSDYYDYFHYNTSLQYLTVRLTFADNTYIDVNAKDVYAQTGYELSFNDNQPRGGKDGGFTPWVLGENSIDLYLSFPYVNVYEENEDGGWWNPDCWESVSEDIHITHKVTVVENPSQPHTHSYSVWQTSTAATCTTAGVETRTCSCGEKETRPIAINPSNHSYGAWATTTAATCTTAGIQTRTCSRNTTHKETRAITALGHSYGAWMTSKVATCAAAGTQTRTCSRNSAHKETRAIAKLTTHKWGAWTTTTKATVSATGLQTRICTVCTVKDTATKTLPKLTAPTITGPKTLTLKQDYAKTSSKVFTIKGNAAPTVTKKSGDAKITWNNTTKKLDIAAGLAPGTYPVTLTVKNSVKTITYTFTLTVEKATRKPKADKAAAIYTDKVVVKLTSSTPNPTIYYTLDGSTPTTKSKFVKSGGTVTISKSAKLKFMAVAPASAKLKNSVVASVKYTIKTKAPDTKAAPANKAVTKNSSITLTAPAGVTLYYTTDGKTPTTKTTTKVAAGKTTKITITKNTNVKVIAVKSGCSASSVVTRTYTLK